MKRYLFNFPALLGLIVLVAVLALIVDDARNTPSSSGDTFDQIDQYVRDQMDGSRIPGLAVAIVEGDQIVHAQGFGDDGNGRSITPQTPFWIGSNTKSFTALATMQLVESGAVDLDAPIQRYLPGLLTGDEVASQITVRHLLNQTSGFSRAAGITTVLDEKVQTLDEAVAGIERTDLNRPVGETFEYSNLNFVVLGLLLQTISGQPWTEYVEQHIFAPLGMENSFTTLDEAEAHGLTGVHRYWFGMPIETEGAYLPGVAPTGYLYSSAEDMARYLSVYLQRGAANGVTLLSADGIDQMLTPATNTSTRDLMSHTFTSQYGRGWFVGEFGAADDARWHLGNLPYFTAWMVLLPETNQAVVVLINAGSQFEIAGANEVMSRIPIGIVNILRGEAPPSGISITRFFILFNAVVLLVLAVQIWSLVRVARRPLHLTHGTLPAAVAAAPLLWEMGLSLVVLIGFPGALGMTWAQSLRAIPDLTLTVLVVAMLWLGTGIVRSMRLVQVIRTGGREWRIARTAPSGLPHAR
jgi:CubicO group peptidase (beta-lactamase class C family)